MQHADTPKGLEEASFSSTETEKPQDEQETTAAFGESRQVAGADELAALIAERDDLKDKLLRALAEIENIRRRHKKEIDDAQTYGVSGFARDLLGVVDNLSRALESLPVSEETDADPRVKAFREGVFLTEREFLKILEKRGVVKRNPLGERFDPNLDQAMFESPESDQPSGTVVQVLQVGYTIGGRVLRPALVGVAKAASGDAIAPKV